MKSTTYPDLMHIVGDNQDKSESVSSNITELENSMQTQVARIEDEITTGSTLPIPAKIKNAIAFIDYEYWYYSARKTFGLYPDISGWFREMKKKFNLLDIIVFGSFTQDDLQLEIPRIREVTNHIVVTDHSQSTRKDVTDFTIVDFMYNSAFDRQSDSDLSYILFSGDGHFQQVVNFLTNKRRRDVAVCGLCGSVSLSLISAASETIQYKYDQDVDRNMCYKYIIENFEAIHNNTTAQEINATFTSTIEILSQRSNLDPASISNALQYLIREGYISREIKIFANDGRSTVLVPDMPRLMELKHRISHTPIASE